MDDENKLLFRHLPGCDTLHRVIERPIRECTNVSDSLFAGERRSKTQSRELPEFGARIA